MTRIERNSVVTPGYGIYNDLHFIGETLLVVYLGRERGRGRESHARVTIEFYQETCARENLLLTTTRRTTVLREFSVDLFSAFVSDLNFKQIVFIVCTWRVFAKIAKIDLRFTASTLVMRLFHGAVIIHRTS